MDTPSDVVGRVGAILRTVSTHEPGGATTSAIARQSDLARPTVHRLLSSLLAEGLVDRDPTTGAWQLGPELFFLGSAARSRYDVAGLARPHVRRLALATGESAFFSARRGDETICLVREDGSFPIRSHVLVEGIRFPLGVASAGMAVLAFLTDPEIDDYLVRADLVATHGEQHAPADVRRRVAETRATGWALNPGLIVEGSWGMGAAVFDVDGRPAWALTLTGIERRFDSGRRGKLGDLLLHEAHELSRSLRRPRPASGPTP